MITSILQDALFKIKNAVVCKINKIKIASLEDENNKITHIYNEIDNLNQYLNIVFSVTILILAIMIGAIYFMFSISIPLAILTSCLLPLLMITIKLVNIRYNKKTKTNDYRQRKLVGNMSEIVERYKLINFINCKSKILKEFDRVNNRAMKSNTSTQKTIMHLESFSALIGNMEFVLILALGVYLYNLEAISIGDIQSFLLYNKLLERPIFLLSKISNIFYAITESLKKIFEFLEIEEENRDGNTKFSNGDIIVKKLSFGYNSANETLKEINFNIKRGKKIAVIGKTGAGKSTIMKILLRFYDSYKGDIFINDINIKEINLQDLRKNIGVVSQDIWLFHGTIRDNILYGNEKSSEEDVIKISKKIGLHDYIEKLPQKYNTIIDKENSNISAGQKQMICIARMMLKNPPIIFLDEATNMLDYSAEENIRKALKEFLNNKTCFIIAHRLSTITESDNIIVLEDGRIVEEGTHEKLLNNKNKYYEMYKQLNSFA